MKNYLTSDYAANKYNKGIVYKFSTGTVEIFLEQYLIENPDKTEADFLALKALSDGIYLEQDRANNAETKNNISLHGLEETECFATEALEDMFLGLEDNKVNLPTMREIVLAFEVCLTKTQCKRAKLYWIDKMTEAEIADLQGVNQKQISKSLTQSRKKLKLFFHNRGIKLV